MKKRRLLAWLITLVMMIGLMPATALAEINGDGNLVFSSNIEAYEMKKVGTSQSGQDGPQYIWEESGRIYMAFLTNHSKNFEEIKINGESIYDENSEVKKSSQNGTLTVGSYRDLPSGTSTCWQVVHFSGTLKDLLKTEKVNVFWDVGAGGHDGSTDGGVDFEVPEFPVEPETYIVTYQYDENAPENAPALPEETSYEKDVIVKVDTTVKDVEGYTFLGWYNEQDKKVADTFEMPGENVVLTGKWKAEAETPDPVTYTVVFYAQNGGEEPYNKQLVEAGETATAPETNPTLSNSKFIGWFTSADGVDNAKWNFDTAITADVVNSDGVLNLYARWDADTEKSGIDVSKKIVKIVKEDGTEVNDINNETTVSVGDTVYYKVRLVNYQKWYGKGGLLTWNDFNTNEEDVIYKNIQVTDSLEDIKNIKYVSGWLTDLDAPLTGDAEAVTVSGTTITVPVKTLYQSKDIQANPDGTTEINYGVTDITYTYTVKATDAGKILRNTASVSGDEKGATEIFVNPVKPSAPTVVDAVLDVLCSDHIGTADCQTYDKALVATDYKVGEVYEAEGVYAVKVTLAGTTVHYPADHVKDTGKTDITVLTFTYKNNRWVTDSNNFVLYVMEKTPEIPNTSTLRATKDRWVPAVEYAATNVEWINNVDVLETINYDTNPVIVGSNGVTLLYKVTVTNEVTSGVGETKEYSVTDKGATYVGYTFGATEPEVVGDAVTGTLTAGTSIDLYFTKTFVATDVDTETGKVTNIAKLGETEVPDGGTEVTIDDGIEDISTLNGKKVRVTTEQVATDFNWVTADFGPVAGIEYGTPAINGPEGVTLLYKVTVTNAIASGEGTAKNYSVTDTGATYVGYELNKTKPEVNEGVVTGELAVNESIDLYFTKTFVATDVVNNKVTNTANVNGTPVTDDGTDVTVVTPEVPVTKVPSIDITKTVDGDKSIRRGQWVKYEITVKNTCDVDLTNVVVTETPDKDQFQKGYFIDDDGDEIKADYVTDDRYTDTYTINKLAVGDKVTLNYKAQVADDATRGKYLINKVAVTSKEGAEASDENNDAYVPKKSSGGGSSSKKKDKEVVTGDVEKILNTEDHFQYVQGYPDGTVGPERNITRAEATVIFFRLLQDHVRAELLTAENNFPDVNLEDWFNLGVSTMEYGDFVSGYEDGYFRPNGKITRAELATIISNFDDLEPVTENRFPDVEGHWAEAYINSAAEKGWLSGYDDGLYRPNQYITRAETMSMINRVLNRRVDAEGLHKDAKQWVDNTEDKWYYYAVLEATNHHDYQRADVKDMETWTAINPNKIWEN